MTEPERAVRFAARLAALNARALDAYSARVVRSLTASLPFGGAAQHFGSILAHNVGKEVRKDTLVIRRTGAAFVEGRAPDDAMLDEVLAAARAIDSAFLAQASRLPLRIVIRYDQVAPIRVRRFRQLSETAWRTLGAWQAGSTNARAALRDAQARPALELFLAGQLGLYAEEARVLAHSVQLPFLLAPLRDRMAAGVHDTMTRVARSLAAEWSHAVHRKPAVSAPAATPTATPADPVAAVAEPPDRLV